jgi:hypothetical protein
MVERGTSFEADEGIGGCIQIVNAPFVASPSNAPFFVFYFGPVSHFYVVFGKGIGFLAASFLPSGPRIH